MTETKEIRIRRVVDLSSGAQELVYRAVEEKGSAFKFSGYAKLTYAETSPLRIISVEPIEGDVNDEFDTILDNIGITD